jgi:ABC-2 type transport system ATP-binding protein
MAAIEVHGLRKQYGQVTAVDGISFQVGAGEVYALLGENGAGKSTTVEILEGYRRADGGNVSVLGVDPSTATREFRDRIGIVLQSSGVEAEFTVREVIELYGGCYRSPRTVDEVVGLVGLDEKVDARVGSLSGGQRRRVDLALGIVGRPEMLFLDEPTTGFDPAARRRSWDLIESLGGDGTTVLLTTHYLDEAEHLADRVGVLAHGRLIAEGTPEELINRHSGTIVSFVVPESVGVTDAPSLFASLLGADVRVSGRLAEATIDQPTAAVHRLTGWAIDAGVELESLGVHRASLEDVYLSLTEPAPSTGITITTGTITSCWPTDVTDA